MTIALKTQKQILASQLNNLVNDRIEEQLREDVQRFFETLKNKVLASFDEYYNENLLLQGHVDLILEPIQEAHKDYYDLLLKRNLEMFQRGALQAERIVERLDTNHSLKAAKPIEFKHDDEDKYTQHFGTIKYTEDYLQDYTFEATEKTLGRVDEEINNILTTGYQEGWGVKDVRNRIMERYSQFEDWEANRIARTEMHTAHNMGMMNGYASQGVEYIQWRSAHDKRVRGTKKTDLANHVKMNGEIIRLGDLFSNGLAFPGDKSGPIYEWINCRCSAVPFLMPYGMMAPPGMVQFRESDLVSFDAPDVNDLLKKHTNGALDWEHVQQYIRTGDLGMISSGVPTHREEEEEEQEEEPIKIYDGVDINKKPITIYEHNNYTVAFHEDVDYVTPEEVFNHLDKLPKELLNHKSKIYFMDEFNREGNAGTMDGVVNGDVRIWKQRRTWKDDALKKEVEMTPLDVLTHELTHALDYSIDGFNLKYSFPTKYESIVKADNKLYSYVNEKTGRRRTPDVFPTSYAGRSYLKYKRDSFVRHERYIEDFAESTKLYLNKKYHKEFCETFPNRAKYLESIYGKPKW